MSSFCLDLRLEENVDTLVDFIEKTHGNCTTITDVNIEYLGDEALDAKFVLEPIFSTLCQYFGSTVTGIRIAFNDCVLDEHVTQLPVHLLTKLFTNCQQLESLTLDDVILVTTDHSEFEDLANGVQNHSSLNELEFVSGNVAQITTDNNNPTTNIEGSSYNAAELLDSFWMAISNLSTMKHLEIEDVPISKSSLQALCQSKYLQELEFLRLPEVNEHISTITQALHHNSSLQKLTIQQCNLNSTAGHTITEILSRSSSSLALNTVKLEIDWDDVCMFGYPIGSILKHNNTLQHMHLICSQSSTTTAGAAGASGSHSRRHQRSEGSAEAYAKAICEGLQYNSTLKCLEIDFQQSRGIYRNDNSRLQAAFTEPLCQVLESKNTTLQSLQVKGGRNYNHVSWNSQINFYFQMNQAGRALWLEGLLEYNNNTTADDNHDCVKNQQQRIIPSKSNNNNWLEAFLSSEQHKDLSIMFYLLSIHPPLCQTLRTCKKPTE